MEPTDPKLSELTVSQFQKLVRETVQEAVAEVIIEFSAVAEAEEQLRYEAEMADYLRHTMRDVGFAEFGASSKMDD